MEITVKNLAVLFASIVALLATILMIITFMNVVPAPEDSTEVVQTKQQSRRRRRQRGKNTSSRNFNTEFSFFFVNNVEFMTFRCLSNRKIIDKLNAEVSGLKLSYISTDRSVDTNSKDLIDLVTVALFIEIKSSGNTVLPLMDSFENRIKRPLLNNECLYIRDIQMNRIPHRVFDLFKVLKQLVMSSCEIDNTMWISNNIGKHLMALEKLDMSFNKFRWIPDVSGFPKLKDLNLDWNIDLTVSDASKVRLFKGPGIVRVAYTIIPNRELSDLRDLYKDRIKFENGIMNT